MPAIRTSVAGFLFLCMHTTFPHNPKSKTLNSATIMSKTDSTAPQRGISLDLYAVLLALILALLVRFNLIPPVKW
jgi:hypothetical protein